MQNLSEFEDVLDEYCQHDVDFRFQLRGSIAICIQYFGHLVLRLPERPTHGVVEIDYDGLAAVRNAGPILWNDDAERSGRLMFEREYPAAEEWHGVETLAP